MKVLVIGAGGREHALAWKLKDSPRVSELHLAPGNPGMAALGIPVPLKPTDIDALAEYALKHAIDLTVVGPEIPLTLGLADVFKAKGLKVFGPSKAAAKLEGSKVEMKEFLRRHNIPTAPFKVFTKSADALAYLDEVGAPIVIKADGLAAGKGVTVAKTVEEAKDAVIRIMDKHEFGKEAGRQVVIEETLRGEEISVFALCDGKNAVLLDYVQDHKQAFDGDEGPNTGGMGTFSPVPGLVKTRDEDDIVRRVLVPTMSGLHREGRPYVGVLFMGIMLTEGGVKVLEYNVRFGDPECQSLLLRLESDLPTLLLACCDGTLDQQTVSWDPRTAVCVTMASGGYPGNYASGAPITGIEQAEKLGAVVFHAGTGEKDGRLVTAGGRVLSVCARGATLDEARATAYAACEAIGYTGKHYRRDIGKRREARKAT